MLRSQISSVVYWVYWPDWRLEGMAAGEVRNPGLGPELFVSDHFGLLAGLVVRPHDPDRLLMLGRDSRDYGKRSPWGDSVAKLPIEQLEELEKVERFWGKGGSYLEARGDHDTIRIGRCGLTKPAKPTILR